MPICTTTTRVLAIVGLGMTIGIVHSMVAKDPVSFYTLKAPASTITPTPTTTPGADDGAPAATTLPSDPIDPDVPAVEIDPLDIAGPIGTITLREAFALYNDGAYFIDARTQDEFDESHIPYALFLPAKKIRTKAGLDELSTIPPGVPIVIYCVGGECDASSNAANAIQRLDLGYTDLRILGRGFSDWVEAGLPVQHADGTITGEEP